MDQDIYWTVDLTFIQLPRSETWTLTLSGYDPQLGRRDVMKVIESGPIAEKTLDELLLVVRTMLAARLNVQLGMDLGLLG